MGRTNGTPNTPKTAAVAYYRVSTARQGQSGLGLEAQRDMVETFARSRGLAIIGEYTEIETGTAKRKRPQLAAAIAHAQRDNARLVIAKLDRLTRNLHFLTALEASGVDFVAADMPDADRLVIHIMAAVAEKEAELISTRTRAALAALKARGVKLGAPQHLAAAGRKGPDAQIAAAVAATTEAGYISRMRAAGMTFQAIADQLNADGKRSRKGRPYHAMTVKRILDRAAATA